MSEFAKDRCAPYYALSVDASLADAWNNLGIAYREGFRDEPFAHVRDLLERDASRIKFRMPELSARGDLLKWSAYQDGVASAGSAQAGGKCRQLYD